MVKEIKENDLPRPLIFQGEKSDPHRSINSVYHPLGVLCAEPATAGVITSGSGSSDCCNPKAVHFRPLCCAKDLELAMHEVCDSRIFKPGGAIQLLSHLSDPLIRDTTFYYRFYFNFQSTHVKWTKIRFKNDHQNIKIRFVLSKLLFNGNNILYSLKESFRNNRHVSEKMVNRILQLNLTPYTCSEV